MRGLGEALDGFLVLSQRLEHATFLLWLLTSFYLLSALGLHPLSFSTLSLIVSIASAPLYLSYILSGTLQAFCG